MVVGFYTYFDLIFDQDTKLEERDTKTFQKFYKIFHSYVLKTRLGICIEFQS